MRGIALALAFLLELAAWAGFASVAMVFGLPKLPETILYMVLLCVVVTFWGLYMSPKAPHQLGSIKHLTVKMVIYSIAAISIFLNLTPVLAGILAAVAAADEIILWKTTPVN
jgi:hypothetical protein